MITLEIEREIVSGGFKATITAPSASLVPKEVFLYRSDIDGEGVYSAVCSVYDIDRYPDTFPDASVINSEGVVFYRKNFVEKTFPQATQLEDFVTSIKMDIELLDEDYTLAKENDMYGTTETIILNQEGA